MTELENLKICNTTPEHKYTYENGWNHCIGYLAAQGRIVPDGWQAVPKEPTRGMIKSAWFAQYKYVGGDDELCEKLAQQRTDDKNQFRKDVLAYTAMLAASPKPFESED